MISFRVIGSSSGQSAGFGRRSTRARTARRLIVLRLLSPDSRGKEEKDHRTKRRPLVRMPDRLVAHMTRWHDIDSRRLVEVGEGEAPKPLTTVLHHGGVPITGRIRRSFAACVRDAGLPEEITPHWMRHTCATWLMERDVKAWDAAAFTGMTTATLEKCYGHHRPGHQGGARRALGRQS